VAFRLQAKEEHHPTVVRNCSTNVKESENFAKSSGAFRCTLMFRERSPLAYNSQFGFAIIAEFAKSKSANNGNFNYKQNKIERFLFMKLQSVKGERLAELNGFNWTHLRLQKNTMRSLLMKNQTNR
jgi:hypothetical protein